jgi:hypothetical protein
MADRDEFEQAMDEFSEASNTAYECLRAEAAVAAERAARQRLRDLYDATVAAAETARAALKDICDEWSEANGATCNRTCSSYGHDEDCKATSIAAYLADLRASAAAARKDSERRARAVALHLLNDGHGHHACTTGDCPHDTLDQCIDAALLDAAQEAAT